ncbi:MAG: homoserine dehydrogenase [Christensenellales bacterium]|jgi:homoserine dehydrogenase
MKKVKIGLLGFGTVGYGVYKILKENGKDIVHKEGVDISVKKVLVKSMDEPNAKCEGDICTTSIESIIGDNEISLIVECLGGVEPARTYILAALNSGRTVVTSNKEVIAKHWPELEKAARKNNVGLYIEATVGGGIPIIKTIFDSMQANSITRIMGIINGTTNYILTKMSEEGCSFEDTLKEAQQLGYAEANPKNDVEGFDVMYKLSILGSLAFHAKIPMINIYREGITRISAEDVRMAKHFGYVIKLLAIGKKDGTNVEARVHPVMIKDTHPLAGVRGVFNAIFMHGSAVDDIMLYGRGAGQMPTASAVVSDVIFACRFKQHLYTSFENKDDASPIVKFVEDWKTAAYIYLQVEDAPGVLSRISGILGEHEVSIATVIQDDKMKDEETGSVPLIFITHEASESRLQGALKDLESLDCVLEIKNMIRVEN